jgi:peptide/nickel transport system substrate-binding protein
MFNRFTIRRAQSHRAATTAFTLLMVLAFLVGCTPQSSAPAAPASEVPAAAEEAEAPSEPKAGGTLYIGQDFGPGTFDPHKNIAWASINIYESIYNGLVKWNEDETELVPDLATSWEISDDGLTYTFKIRQGVKFHNGREMTAEDVKFSLDRLRDPDVSVFAANYTAVESVEVVDAETVQVNLSQPFGTLLLFLVDRYSIIPEEAVETLETQPVGTGPFMLEEYVLDQYVRLVKNPDYYEEGVPYLDAVEFKILSDEASKEAAVRSQSVDMAWFRDPRQAEALANDLPNLVSAPGIPSRHIYIRLNMCEEPFNDVNVRRAFSVAMDREALVNTVIPPQYGGSVSGFLEPSSPFFWTGDEHPYYTHDVEQAKSLLAEAGYPDGITIDAYKVVAANQLDVDAAQVLEQQWAEAGIDVTIQPMEVGQILADWNAGTGKMNQVGITWEPDPDTRLYNVFHSSSAVAQAYCLNDPELDELLERGRTSTDRAERMEIYQAAQDRIADQAYVLVLYGYPLRWETWYDYVEGYHNVPSNSRWQLRYTWLNK